MTAIAFNPSRSVVFDLSQGSVRVVPGAPRIDGVESQRPAALASTGARSTMSAGTPHVLLSTETMMALVSAHPDPKSLGNTLGAEVAERAMLRRPSQAETNLRSATLSEVADLLGGEIALLGLGNLRVERWGLALLFVIDPCVLDARADRFLEGLIEGAVTRAATPRGSSGRQARAAIIDRDRETIRFLIGNENAAERAASLYASGAVFTDIVSSLQERSG